MISPKAKINESGFTIMEAVVTVAIITIMSAVYLTGYRQANQKIILDQAISGMINDLRLAQNMAMNVKVFSGGGVPQGGYGINLANSSGSYILYADTSGNDKQYSVGVDGIVMKRIFDFPIVIKTTGANNINFLPPSPDVYFNGSSAASGSSVEIILEYGSGGLTKKIKINGDTGQISAE